ncbi:hypothetical protein [Geodermatophilus sabuli]|uniref:Uncharacterized protein n=1 Tax=Geodermatophilus sabuli TaxID=1564158 RepID=A0A285EG82_9ACTN|nr:hypothetical protein [Geodermatophilus sabuli]MBB3083133.1 hypothetical protein [Geodermatophilus sabuli]SNX98129.1 hypothetical protein SAMN06893097_109209 [Geodermatophilus sabuli]
MNARPGGGPGLLQRLRPAPVTVADLRDAVSGVLPRLTTPRLRIAVVEDRIDGPVLVVEEGERRQRVPLQDLAEDMTDARVAPGPDAVGAALVAWVQARPVPDATAAETGVAVLDWTDRTRTAIGWRVVVRRGRTALPWTPSADLGREQLRRVREAAAARSADVPGELRVEGPVALWSHPQVPLLASAVLVRPDRLLDRIAAAGLAVSDPHVVVTPSSALACAGAGVAARLAGETGEACVRLPWQHLARLRWI